MRSGGFRTPLGCLAVIALGATQLPRAAAAGDNHPSPTADAIVAEVGPRKIYQSALVERVRNKLPRSSYHPTPSPTTLQRLEAEAIAILIEEELLLLEAERRNIKPDPKRIEALVAGEQKKYGGKEKFDQFLARAGQNIAFVRNAVARHVTLEATRRQLVEEPAAVSREQAKRHFDQNPQQYVMPARWRLKHVLVKADPSAGNKGREEAKKRAEEIHAALAGKVTFDAAAKRFTGADFQDLGWVHQGSLLPEVEAAVKELKPGELSPPTASLFGYHLVQLMELQIPQPLTFDAVADSVMADLSAKRRTELLAQLLERCRKRWPVKTSLASPGER